MEWNIESYLTYVSTIRNLSDATVAAYAGDLRSFAAWLDREEPESTCVSADTGCLRRYVASLSRRNASVASINRVISTLRGFFRFLVERGVRNDNPTDGVRNLKNGRHLPEFLFGEEIERILGFPGHDFAAVRDRLLLEILYSTGCRISELINVDLSDVRFKRKSILVHGKGRKDRVVFLGGSAHDTLEEYVPLRAALVHSKATTGEQALILNQNGTRLTQRGAAMIIHKRAVDAGLAKKVSPHTFRHSFATHILDAGADIRVVGELLGHANISTTQIYTHVGLGKLKRIYEQAHPHGGERRR